MVLFRILVVLLVALTVIYWCLWMYFRSGEKVRLEERWQIEQPPLPRHTFVDVEIQRFQANLRRKLLLWVYAVPVLAVTAIVAYLNYG
ncbi:MAG: hypothetical protein AAGE03_09580 [Pseudomonadota bacterium]